MALKFKKVKGGEKMDKSIWTIIIIAAIVAIVASLITGQITGNVISVAKGTAGKVYTTKETYSKTEVDAKLKDMTTRDKFLDVLNKCEFESRSDDNLNGNDVCKEKGKKCILGQMFAEYYIQNYTLDNGISFDKDFSLENQLLGCTDTSGEVFNRMIEEPSFFKSAVKERGGLGIEANWLCC